MFRFHKIKITPGFFLLLGGSLLLGAGEVLPLVALAALLHEIGHLLPLSLFGVHVEEIYFTAFGVEIQADTRYLPYWKDIICTLAGPLANILSAFVLSRMVGDYLFAGANLLQGCFNLLPLAELDGARALHLFLSWLIDPVRADRICCVVEFLCALLFVILSLYLVICHHTGGFLLVAVLGIFVGIWHRIRLQIPTVSCTI